MRKDVVMSWDTKLPLRRWRGLVLGIIPVVWCLVSAAGGLTFFDNKFLDWRFQYRGEIDSPAKVVYVDIDSQSISEIGGFPWSRMYFARVASALIDQAGAKAVGIDIVFSENGVAESIDWKKRVEGNRELARYLASNPPVVVAASYAAAIDRDVNGKLIQRELPRVHGARDSTVTDVPELPHFRIGENNAGRQWSPALVGLIDTVNGATRVVPAFAPSSIRTFHHMAVELARLHFDVPLEGVKIDDQFLDLMRPDGSRAAHIPLREGQLLDVNWFSAWDSARNPRVGVSTVFSYAEMLKSENAEEKKSAQDFFAQPDFKDAIVLIGPVDPLLQDLGSTPLDDVPVPKVGVHGNLLKMIVAGKYLRSLPSWNGIAWLEFSIAIALTALVSALARAGGSRSRWTKLAAAGLLAGYIAFCFWIFKQQHLVLPMTLPIGAALTTSFAAVTWQLVREEKQKGRIKGLFGTYVSPQLVERMVESGEEPRLGGVEENITAYFSDIQSFSGFSEKLSPPRLVELMNEYLTACTDIVQAEGGTLDKYIGDAVVAMFGAPLALPDHAHRACVAAVRVQRRNAELREKWRHEGEKWPQIVHALQTRIGLNTGPVVVGNMGSHTRFNYTMMGDNVNLAARMESGAKSYGVYTMVTESTKVACENHGGDRIVFRFLDRIVVKGRTQPVPVFEAVGLKEDLSARAEECLRNYDRGIQAYLATDWAAAREAFGQSALAEANRPGETPGVETNPSMVMRARCEHLLLHPPAADWDGIYVMKEK
jgi:adenylate cyclase